MTFVRYAAPTALILFVAAPAGAQDDGGGFIQRFLQDKLSSAGREVSISAFEGLLAGQARLGELTIADDDGVWLILRGAVLDWSRAALLRGNLSVSELSAEELIVVRKPIPGPDTAVPDAPSAEASGFSLPELPVAIRVDKLAIARAELGEALLGEAAVLSLDGSVQLAGGDGSVDIRTERLDGPSDTISLQGAFANESRELSLDLALKEEPGGLVGNLINLPGAPSLDLSVQGAGPLSDFAADIALRTDDQDRIAGTVTLTGTDAGSTDFAADIGGDITPLLPAEFHDFFGEDIRLATRGNRSAEGAIDLSELTLAAQSLSLEGSARIGANGLPEAFALDGTMANRDGTALRLPVSGPGIFVGEVTLDAAFDSATSDRWTLEADLAGLETEAATLGSLDLNGEGTITTEPRAVTANIQFDLAELLLADAALAQAVGDALNGVAVLAWEDGAPLSISSLQVNGADYGLTVAGDLQTEGRSMQVDGEASLRADDLSRFSTISGQTLTGQVTADLTGSADVLGGQFDIALDLEGDGLSIGQETADRLLTEPVTLSTAVRRDTAGTTLEKFELRSRAITADAQGAVGGGTSDIGFTAALSDIGLVMPGQEGALTLSGDAREEAAGDWQVGLDLDGPWDLTGTVDGRVKSGESDVTLDLSLPDIAPLVPGHTGPVSVKGQAAETGAAGAWDLDLDVGGPYDLAAAVEGLYAPGETDVSLDLSLPDIAPLVPGHEGAVNLSGNAAETDTGGWQFQFGGTGPYDAELDLGGNIEPDQPGKITLSAGLPDIAPLVPSLSGPVRAEGTATDAGEGLWQIDFNAGGPLDAEASVDGVVGGGQSDLSLDVSVPDLSPLVPQLSGPLDASGTAKEIGDGRWDVDFDVDGPNGATAGIAGAVGSIGTDVDLSIAVPDVSPFAPGITGALRADASAAQAEDGAWDLAVDATGPYSSTVSAGGTYGNGASELSFEAAMPNVAPLAGSISGPLSLSGTASEAEAGAWNVAVDAGGPYNTTATVNGQVGNAATALDLALSVPSLSPFAPGVTGGVEATGSVRQQDNGYTVDLTTSGPQGASTAIGGTVASDFSTLELSVNGNAPLGLANLAIQPAAILGTANFDLAVNGPPSLDAVSGTVTINGARLTNPGTPRGLDGINVQVNLNGQSLQLDASANGPDGGSLGAQGSLQLDTMNADLQATLNEFVLTDPLLYRTSLGGRVSVTGPLTGGATIDGRINVGRTEVQIPEGSLGYGGAIPNITHIGEPADVFLTRERAGLVVTEKDSGSGSGGGGGPVYNLNVQVNVPGPVFIRGRGLDTEMGGALRLTGTTANPNPVGEIDVIRGRLDILGKRLDVEDGQVSLAGGLQPYIDISASSSRDDFEFVARISGPIDDPEFDLTSVPSLPDDEVLARFLFNKGLDDLSPLQAVQLANAVAILTGRGGVGVLGNLREGIGLDDLDVATTEEGDAEVRAGKYISDNVYTEFVADSEGDTEIDINIDLTKNFTIKGTAESSGDSSIGIYWERDY
ncbi:translocation/assembly module TamB domain-containing protein [Tropicimonas aquimaris]|uniref:Translocation/assembly module TamB domain-containing protein n=1 Tax=Tropicimonas aquimaris TaxID=914152 RepID=A0ABW3IUH4_9RHOB